MPAQLPLLAITGSSGRIGSALRPLLRAHYRLRLLDLNPPIQALEEVEEFQQLDVSRLEPLQAAFADVGAVLHLAGQPSTSAPWSSVLKENIEASHSVLEAARRNGIAKVVFASTNHVMGFYHLERAWPIDTRAPIRPDSLYGVSKACGEALARYYADAFQMSIICLRIGWFLTEQPADSVLWISPRDLAQIVMLSLQTSRGFAIYNATSDNPQRHWDLQAARDELGYAPEDKVSVLDDSKPNGLYVDPQAGVLADDLC